MVILVDLYDTSIDKSTTTHMELRTQGMKDSSMSTRIADIKADRIDQRADARLFALALIWHLRNQLTKTEG